MLYILVGLLSGILGAMGMGGGTILIPLLITFFAVEQKSAQFINLIAFVFMAIIAVIIHSRNKLIDFQVGTIFAVFGAVFAFIVSMLTMHIESSVLGKIFGGFLIIVGVTQLLGVIKKSKSTNQKKH